MRSEILVLITGMALVTFIPRLLPSLFIEKMKFPARFEKFLRLIPYTAMAALVFPSVFAVDSGNIWIGVDSGNIWIGIAGGAVAALLAWKRLPVMVSVIAAIAVDMLIYVL